MTDEDLPDCPVCETDVFVGRDASRHIDHVCHFCGERFDAPRELRP